MQLLLTSAAPSNIGQGGDTIIQTQNCVSPCAWVKLIFSVSRIVIIAQGPCFLHVQMTRFVRVILDQGAMSSSRGGRDKKKTTRICACHPCASHTSVSFKKKNYPSQILTVILVQGPCSNIQSHTIFVRSRAAVSRRRNSVILAQGPCNSVQRRRQAQSEVRTSGPALEGTISRRR